MHDFKEKMLYNLSIVLSALDLLLIASVFLLNLYHYEQIHVMDATWLIISMILILFLFLLRKPLEQMRINFRMKVNYDEYGRSKQFQSYKKMSLKQQTELDQIKMLEMERVLPSSTVLEMTRKGSANAEQDMKELVGLEDVKEKMAEMAARMEFDKQNGTAQANSCMHMCFFGPPGTGKTTCARIMTGFLYQYGYIKNNRLIEVDGNFLADDYASLKTEMLVQKAFGGVLFIDEAYSLLNNLSGQEAIATLIKQMEDNKDKFVLILAGYEDEMKALIEANPGFLSRIKEYFYFKGYNEEELNHIFLEMAIEVGLTVSAAAQNTFKDYMTESMKDYHFGNARTVRNVLDSCINKHSLNLKKGIVREAFRIEKEDISYESIELAGFPWNRNRR